MEKSHVKTFYNNLADEVDQHFARALQSATTATIPNQGGPTDTTCWAHHPIGQQPYHTDIGSAYPPSPSLMSSTSPGSGGPSIYPEAIIHQVQPDASSYICPPPPSFITGSPPSFISGCPSSSGGTIVYSDSTHHHHHHHLVHTDVNAFAGPPTPSFTIDSSNSRGAIIYPEFVDHLVHPDVDSFKDIPKLPGQTDPRGR